MRDDTKQWVSTDEARGWIAALLAEGWVEVWPFRSRSLLRRSSKGWYRRPDGSRDFVAEPHGRRVCVFMSVSRG
jgi:hypothetical protein